MTNSLRTAVATVAAVAVGAAQTGDAGHIKADFPVGALALTASTTGLTNEAVGIVAIFDPVTDEVRYPFPTFRKPDAETGPSSTTKST